ncbi:ABC transporter permease [Chloroflexota bacterium]
MEKKMQFVEYLRIIWAIAAKDILDAIKNKTTLSLFLGVLIMMLSGHALPLMLKLNDTPMVVVYDPAKSKIIRGLSAQEDFRLAVVDSQDLMEEIVAASPEVRLGLILPADYDELAGSEERVELQGFYPHWADLGEVSELAAFFEEKLAGASWQSIRVLTADNKLYPSPEDDGFHFMIAMVLTIMILTIGVALVPYLFVEEKEAFTLGVILVSPARYGQVIIGKALTGVFYCLVASGVVLLFDAKWIVRWDLVLLAIFLGSFLSVLMGLFIGTIVDSASSIGMWAGLGLGILIIPSFLQVFINSSWPDWLQGLLPWLPSVALINLVQLSMSAPVPAALLWRGVVSLAVGIVVVFALIIWKIRRLDL